MMRSLRWVLALSPLILGLWPTCARAQVATVPFGIDPSRIGESVIDLSGFLSAPAGRDGFLRVEGAHLVRPDGTRFRFWGVNLCGPDCFPSREGADRLADDLARLGINVVRFHHMDSGWSRIFDSRADNTRHLDPESLDRLDYLISRLKARGIYSNLNLNVGRQYRAGDGVRDHNLLGYAKGVTYFDPRLLELQREYARQLLTHRNAYTGQEYREEPAVATVELINENSMLEAWVGGRLIGQNVEHASTWSPIPVSYDVELTEQYNAWLSRELSPEVLQRLRQEAGVSESTQIPRLRPNQLAAASVERFRTEARFYMTLERDFFQGMRRLLKDELGLRMPVVGTADHNDSISGYPHIAGNLELDYIDGHGYWEHPRLDGKTWIKNTPMVNDPLDSTVTQFARTPVVGRPFTISEINHPFPHEYSCEGWPILTAYALFHDWDGIYWFTWGHARNADPGEGIPRNSCFDFSNDPVKLANLAACGVMWHRRDVRPAERTIIRSYDQNTIIETLRMNRNQERPFFTPGFARSTALEHATRFTLDGTPATPFPPASGLDRIVSDTGELVWQGADRQRGLVTIVTERSQGLIGFVRGSGQEVPHLRADVANDFCALVLTALDDKTIAQSGRLLLAATGKATNTGFRWEADHQTLADWGHGPVVIEPVVGKLTLRGLAPALGLRARPLSAEGRLLDEDLPVSRDGETWTITLGQPATTWCRIDVSRDAP